MGLFKVIRKKLGRWFSIPWYPFAISAYPVLALMATNVGQVDIEAGIRPLFFSVVLAGLLFFVLWLFFRRVYKAAFLATLWLALFFSYGHVYITIDEKYPDSNYTLWLAVAWIILFLLTLVWVTRPRLTFASSTVTLNVVALALLVMAAWEIVPEVESRSAHALA
ncbi:MAG: hypothetical protein EHM40_09130, partial [Chloroflexi bacterium]